MAGILPVYNFVGLLHFITEVKDDNNPYYRFCEVLKNTVSLTGLVPLKMRL